MGEPKPKTRAERVLALERDFRRTNRRAERALARLRETGGGTHRTLALVRQCAALRLVQLENALLVAEDAARWLPRGVQGEVLALLARVQGRLDRFERADRKRQGHRA